MYTSRNYLTKKSLREDVSRGEKISVFQPNQMFASQSPPENGIVSIEGPHYPLPHKWWCDVELKDGFITKIIR